MSENEGHLDEDRGILHQHAVRTPLPDEGAERVFHENMMAVADARERKADLLASQQVSVAGAYEREVESLAATFRRRLRRIAGDDYEEVARAYHRGERDDRVGRLTAYYVEGLWRVQERSTIANTLFFPLILRYPDSFTVNLRFASGCATPESVRYESPEHASVDPDEEFVQQYRDDSRYEQERAAEYIHETAQVIRDEFPAPDDASFAERKYGGVVSAGGRRGPQFSEMLTSVTPDPERFTEPVTESVLVPAGTEAERTRRRYIPDVEDAL